MKNAFVISVAVAFAVGLVGAYDWHKQHMRQLDPNLSPGLICDAVAIKNEPKPTVRWYLACLDYAAEIQAKERK
jgi:hypothetical protein